MMLLPIAERIAQMDDNTIAMMCVFNVAEMQGSLPFEIHVRKL